MPLTKKQHDLYQEVLRIAHLTGLDHTSIGQRDPAGRTVALQIFIHKMVVAEIIVGYAFIDEALANIIAVYFFRRPGTGTEFIKLWRTKKFGVFCQRILDEIYLLKKMELVHAIKPLPKEVRSTIYRLNDIRNAFAHSLFPENRKEHKKTKRGNSKVLYKDKDIRTYEGLKLFVDDTSAAYTYLVRRFKRQYQ
jgi:hypothetical protein